MCVVAPPTTVEPGGGVLEGGPLLPGVISATVKVSAPPSTASICGFCGTIASSVLSIAPTFTRGAYPLPSELAAPVAPSAAPVATGAHAAMQLVAPS